VGITMQQEEAMSEQSAAISKLQNEMKQLKDMLAQLVTVQMGNAAPAHVGNQQQHQVIDLDINEINNESIRGNHQGNFQHLSRVISQRRERHLSQPVSIMSTKWLVLTSGTRSYCYSSFIKG